MLKTPFLVTVQLTIFCHPVQNIYLTGGGGGVGVDHYYPPPPLNGSSFKVSEIYTSVSLKRDGSSYMYPRSTHLLICSHNALVCHLKLFLGSGLLFYVLPALPPISTDNVNET